MLPSAAVDQSFGLTREGIAQASALYTAFFSLLWLMVFFFQREADTCASSPAAARQLTPLLNGGFASAAVSI